MFHLKQDEGGSDDPGDAARVGADPAQSLERNFEQGIRALGDAMDATDHLFERLLVEVEFTALRLFDRAAEAVAGILVAEIG